MGEAQPAGGRALVTAEVTVRRFRLALPGMALALGALILALFALGVLLGSPLMAGVVAWEARGCWLAFSGWWWPGASRAIPSGGC